MTPTEFLEKPAEKIVLYPDPVLLAATNEIADLEPWRKIAPIMFVLMNRFYGCGLAAPQVGLPYSMFVLNVTKPLVIINPVIVSAGDRTWEETEGCLSLPDQKFNVTRPRKIKARWTDLDGKEQCATFEGWTGRAFQHEDDHLSGILINEKSPASAGLRLIRAAELGADNKSLSH